MLVIHAEIRIPADEVDTLAAVARPMCEKSEAEEGCHLYAFSVDVSEPGLVRITEEWESQEALDAHFQTPHMGDFQAGMAGLTSPNVKATKFMVSSSEDMMG